MNYHGKITGGGYASKERFKETEGEEEVLTNDSAVTSGRFYLDLTDLGSKKMRFTLDLRDKHDFFEKLDREKQELTGKNTLQIRKLVLNYDGASKLEWSLGRFPAFNTGAVYIDGAELAFKINRKFKLGVFGGQSPKEELRDNLDINLDSQAFGAFGILQTSTFKGNYTYVATAFISVADDSIESVNIGDGETAVTYERTFLYNNTTLHFGNNTRLFSLLYYDVTPNTSLQSYWLSMFHRFAPKFELKLSAFEVNANEYKKNQDLLEDLDASSYSQFKLAGEFYFSNKLSKSIAFYALSGSREVDSLSKTEMAIGFKNNKFINFKNSFSLFVGQRKNFVSDDQFFKISLGHFRRTWELNLDVKSIKQKFETGEELNPLYVELSFSIISSKRLFTTLSLQSITDEKVNITSGLFKVTYRFGNKEIPPIRDGAPPKGRL